MTGLVSVPEFMRLDVVTMPCEVSAECVGYLRLS